MTTAPKSPFDAIEIEQASIRERKAAARRELEREAAELAATELLAD